MSKHGVHQLSGPYLTQDGSCVEGEEQDVEGTVEERIKDQAVIVFSKSYCSYCKKVKTLMENNGVAYAVVELDQHKEGEKIQKHLLNLTKQRTVPNVFVKGAHIGGASETIQKWNSGEIQQLIQSNSI